MTLLTLIRCQTHVGYRWKRERPNTRSGKVWMKREFVTRWGCRKLWCIGKWLGLNTDRLMLLNDIGRFLELTILTVIRDQILTPISLLNLDIFHLKIIWTWRAIFLILTAVIVTWGMKNPRGSSKFIFLPCSPRRFHSSTMYALIL